MFLSVYVWVFVCVYLTQIKCLRFFDSVYVSVKKVAVCVCVCLCECVCVFLCLCVWVQFVFRGRLRGESFFVRLRVSKCVLGVGGVFLWACPCLFFIVYMG